MDVGVVMCIHSISCCPSEALLWLLSLPAHHISSAWYLHAVMKCSLVLIKYVIICYMSDIPSWSFLSKVRKPPFMAHMKFLSPKQRMTAVLKTTQRCARSQYRSSHLQRSPRAGVGYSTWRSCGLKNYWVVFSSNFTLPLLTPCPLNTAK